MQTVDFNELNLTHDDYTVMENVTGVAEIICVQKRWSVTFTDADNSFSVKFKRNWYGRYNVKKKHTGIMKMGYFDDMPKFEPFYAASPLELTEKFANRMAMFQIVEAAQQTGADGIIQPTVSSTVRQVSKHTYIYKTTVVAKAIRLNKDSDKVANK